MSQLDLFSNAPAAPVPASLDASCFEPSPCLVPEAPKAHVATPSVTAEVALDSEPDAAEEMARLWWTPPPVLLPDVHDFADLFTEAVDADRNPFGSIRRGDMEISAFCSIDGPSGYSWMYVRPAPRVVDAICERMIPTSGGVFFHVVVRDDGTALVVAKYNSIIGDRWLAYVDSGTVQVSELPAPKPAPAKTTARRAQRSLAEEPAAAPTKRLDARQQELLSLVAVEGNRAVYTRDEVIQDWKLLKSVVETLGGKWRTGGKKRRGGWDFPDDVDAAEVIRLAQESGEILDLKAAGFFPTPEAMAEEVVRLAEIQPNSVVLEPSAGTGRIALAVRRLHPDARVLCCELLEQNRAELTRLGFELVGTDFLALDPRMLPPIDRCIANPPFAKFAEVDHVEHMLRCVRPGGRVASIMSSAIKYRDAGPYSRLLSLIESSGGTIEDCPPGSFLESGTGVSTVMVTLRRPEAA